MKNNKGFTLIEISLTIAILSIVLTVLVSVLVYFFQGYSFSQEEYQSISNTQTTLTRMIRDIREANPGENGAWPLVAATDTSLTFYSDVTNDGRTDLVRYFLEGSDIKRGVIQPTGSPVTYPVATETITIVASYINNGAAALFGYYNGAWPADTLNNPVTQTLRTAATRYITISLNIDTKPSTSTGGYQLTGGVHIRSMKDN